MYIHGYTVRTGVQTCNHILKLCSHRMLCSSFPLGYTAEKYCLVGYKHLNNIIILKYIDRCSIYIIFTSGGGGLCVVLAGQEEQCGVQHQHIVHIVHNRYSGTYICNLVVCIPYFSKCTVLQALCLNTTTLQALLLTLYTNATTIVSFFL